MGGGGEGHSTTPYGDGWEEKSIKDDMWDIKGT